jgi:hypothetical protein
MRFLVGILLIGVVVVFGLTVWPTVWNERTASISGRSVQVRSHRINGSTEFLTMSGWKPLPKQAISQEPFKPLDCPHLTAADWDNDVFAQRICIRPSPAAER